jgi:hypothetical protein
MRTLLKRILKGFKGETENGGEVQPPSSLPIEPLPPEKQPQPEPQSVPESIESFSIAAELILKEKAGTIYATCPHCSASWNLRERLMRPRRSQIINELICPACEQPVSVRREFLAK